MGSPNFYTNVEGVNFAVESESIDSDEMSFIYKKAQELVDKLNTYNMFHKVILEHGHYDGFQLYIDKQVIEDETVRVWNQYKEFSSVNGHNVEPEFCEYFAKGVKNVTAHTLKHAVKNEYLYFANELIDFARKYNLGEIVGKFWTSSVSYDWLTK